MGRPGPRWARPALLVTRTARDERGKGRLLVRCGVATGQYLPVYPLAFWPCRSSVHDLTCGLAPPPKRLAGRRRRRRGGRAVAEPLRSVPRLLECAGAGTYRRPPPWGAWSEDGAGRATPGWEMGCGDDMRTGWNDTNGWPDVPTRLPARRLRRRCGAARAVATMGAVGAGGPGERPAAAAPLHSKSPMTRRGRDGWLGNLSIRV